MAGGRNPPAASAATGRPGTGSAAARSAAAAEEARAPPADEDQAQEPASASQAAPASGGSTGGGKGAVPAAAEKQRRSEAKRLRDLKDGLLKFCDGQTTALSRLLNDDPGSHQLLRAKAILVEACLQVEKLVSAAGCWVGSRLSPFRRRLPTFPPASFRRPGCRCRRQALRCPSLRSPRAQHHHRI